MRTINKITASMLLLGSTLTVAYAGNTLFSITPSETNLYLSANGSGNVMYTVTNNATVSVMPSISPGYQSAGNNLTISSNTCNSLLSSGASCTFRVLISGANQPTNFTITPRVCGFNGFMCSITSSSVEVIVTTPSAGLPTRAFEEVIDNDNSTTSVVGININDTSDIISSPIGFTNNVNSVALSPDGSKLYAIQHQDEGGYYVRFFNVMSDALIAIQDVYIPTPPSFLRVPSDDLQMVITPNGKTLFISRYGSVSLRAHSHFIVPLQLYRIDLTSDAPVATPILDPDNIFQRGSRGLIVSPDSKTVYVGTSTNYIVAMPVDAVTVSADNIVAQGIPADEHVGLAVDSSGSTLFVGNQADGSVSILSVNGREVNFQQTILDDGSFNGASGLAVSPDGETLYVAETGSDAVVAVSLNSFSTSVQPNITGAFGLSLSPNGATLYVTQFGGQSTTAILNAVNFFDTPSTLFLGGSSLTIGLFIGP